MWKVEVRLMSALSSFDRPYTYLSDFELTVGEIVALPFGAGDRYQYAVVVEVSVGGEGEDLKKVAFSLPEPYRLYQKDVDLADFLSEMCFCSFCDSAKLMLPSGLSVKTEEYYERGENFSKAENTSLLEEFEKESTPTLSLFEKEEIAKFIKQKYIVKRTRAVCHVNEKKQLFAKLSESFDTENLDTLLKGVKKREEYKKVIEYLSGMQDAEVSALCTLYSLSIQSLRLLEKRGVLKLFEKRVNREPYSASNFKAHAEKIVLSQEQQKAYDTLLPLMEDSSPRASLLWGVTGSGKTSVILSLVDRAVESGRGVIILVPEIALTLQNASKLFARYKDLVAVIHSGMSQGERHDAWEDLRSGKKRVVLGTRSAVFAPVQDLAMIVIDEEQDDSYKSDTTPRYHARDVARFRCAAENALMLLSSATPDIETFYRAKNGKYTLVTLSKRYGGATLPEIVVSDSIEEALHPDSMIGGELEKRICDTLLRGEQAILFLNRRGLRKILVCRDCKSGVHCPNCSVPMTLHSDKNSYYLSCHYCGYRMTPPDKCPECKSKNMQYRGYGTEKLEEEIKKKFPTARVLRMDADTTSHKHSHDEIISSFARHEADILIGTQMVTKGHDFPDVTLVGVVMADLSLMVSDYRACEHTFSLLTQVVGRAGRGKKKGCAVIQTANSTSEIIELCTTQDYENFYNGEIALRRALLFPPFCTVGTFTLSSDSETEVEKAAQKLSDTLATLLSGEFSDVKIIAQGPFEASPYKLKNQYRQKIVVKYANTRRTREMLRRALSVFSLKDKARCVFDPSPKGI